MKDRVRLAASTEILRRRLLDGVAGRGVHPHDGRVAVVGGVPAHADVACGGEAAVGEVVEEDEVGHEARHRDKLPVGRGLQLRVDHVEARNALAVVEVGKRVAKFLARIGRHECGLPRIEPPPKRVLLRRVRVPVLVDGVVGPDAAVVAAKVVRRLARHG